MQKYLLYLVCIVSIFISSLAQATEKVTVYTEEFPPFQYTENGTIIGASAEIVQAVLNIAGIEYEIKSFPWARSYGLVQKEANTLIFSISRRPAREELFKWVGIIVPARYSVFSLQSQKDVQVNSLDDIAKYKIGTTIDDARETYLVNKGFELKMFDRSSGNRANISNYRKLKRNRIDLWPMPDAVAFYISRAEGDTPENILHRAFPLQEISIGGYYLAASLTTSDKIFQKIQNTLRFFKETPEYKTILTDWGVNE